MQGEMRRIEALETQKRELVDKLREASGFVLDADLVRNETKRGNVPPYVVCVVIMCWKYVPFEVAANGSGKS